MKINDTRKNNNLLFSDLYQGDVFICGKLCCIKIIDEYSPYNAVSLATGTLFKFNDNKNVVRVEAELVIKN